jgi:hypothetical protein
MHFTHHFPVRLSTSAGYECGQQDIKSEMQSIYIRHGDVFRASEICGGWRRTAGNGRRTGVKSEQAVARIRIKR